MAETTDASSPQQRVEATIRDFPFDDYGLDGVSYLLEDQPDTQEWVPALARAVLEAAGGDGGES